MDRYHLRLKGLYLIKKIMVQFTLFVFKGSRKNARVTNLNCTEILVELNILDTPAFVRSEIAWFFSCCFDCNFPIYKVYISFYYLNTTINLTRLIVVLELMYKNYTYVICVFHIYLYINRIRNFLLYKNRGKFNPNLSKSLSGEVDRQQLRIHERWLYFE